MNSGFRNLPGGSDTTKFKAFLLAVAVQMLLLPLLAAAGLVDTATPAFYPLGVALGGFFFGLAMNWGGGCAAGVWYKLGAGNTAVFATIVGLILGYSTAETGALEQFRVLVQSFGRDVFAAPVSPPWWIRVTLAAVLLVLLLRQPVSQPDRGWGWKKTGILVGCVGTAAWVASSLSGRPYGVAILPGSKDVLTMASDGNARALTWSLFFVAGVPLGGYLAASGGGEFKWSSIQGAAIWRMLGGGAVMGISASLAGGCTVGHGLAGLPLLSLAGITFVAFAIPGAWAGLAFEKK